MPMTKKRSHAKTAMSSSLPRTLGTPPFFPAELAWQRWRIKKLMTSSLSPIFVHSEEIELEHRLSYFPYHIRKMEAEDLERVKELTGSLFLNLAAAVPSALSQKQSSAHMWVAEDRIHLKIVRYAR